MRNPNGYGSVTKLSGHRRNPYWVKKTVGWNDKGQPIYETIGYAPTREEGNIMLAEYNKNPYDVDKAKITLNELFNLWLEKKAPKLGRANQSCLKSGFKHINNLGNVSYKEIKAYQMQDTIDKCGKGYSTQNIIKNLWTHLDKFALELDVSTSRYADLLTTEPTPPTSRVPFTNEEIQTLWEHQNETWVDTVLIFLYSGWRISELLNLRSEDVDLEAGTMKGGIKTKAGKNRIVPIHSKIKVFIENHLNEGGEKLINIQLSKYRACWNEIMSRLNMNHTPHECRHTFETRLDSAGANRKCIDLMMGHTSKDVGNRVYNHKTIEELKSTIELLN